MNAFFLSCFLVPLSRRVVLFLTALGCVTAITYASVFSYGRTELLTSQIPNESVSPATSTIISFTIEPSSVMGGRSAVGTVTLGAPAPKKGRVITITSDSAEGGISVDPRLNIPFGKSKGSFNIRTQSVTTEVVATITSTLGASSRSAILRVTKKGVALASITLSPTNIIGGTASQGSVILTGPAPPGGATVLLSRNNGAVASVPSGVIIPEGRSSATFTIRTNSVNSTVSCLISGLYGGATQSATLTIVPVTIIPPVLSSLSLSPASLIGGANAQATVTLSQPAPSGGALVALSSSNSAVANVPAKVTVPAGSVGANFSVTTGSVSSTTTVTISGSYGGTSRSAALTIGATVQSGAIITLNPSTTHQTMRGLTAVDFAGQWLFPTDGTVSDNPDYATFRATLLDQAVNDLGLTEVRLEIKSSVENTRDFWAEYKAGTITGAEFKCYRYSVVNDNSNANSINASGFHFTQLDEVITKLIVPLRAVMAARGEVLRVNLCYISFTGQMAATGCPGGLGNTHNANPAEYAEFVLATYQHIQAAFGWVPDTWEIMLEPGNNNNWTISQMGPAIVAAGNLLSANGFTPRFVAPSSVTRVTALQWFDQLIQTPGALQYMDTISFHTYNGWNDVSGMQAFATRAAANNIKSAMLEHIGATVDELHFELKNANISSFLQYVLASPSGTGNNRLFGISGTTVTVSDFAARYFRQYFRHVRPGAVRVGASSTNGALDPLAFRNTDGKYVLVTKTTGASGTFTIGGLPAGTYGIYYTTATQADVNLADQLVTAGQSLSTSIPAAGAITVYAKTGGD